MSQERTEQRDTDDIDRLNALINQSQESVELTMEIEGVPDVYRLTAQKMSVDDMRSGCGWAGKGWEQRGIVKKPQPYVIEDINCRVDLDRKTVLVTGIKKVDMEWRYQKNRK